MGLSALTSLLCNVILIEVYELVVYDEIAAIVSVEGDGEGA